jgi:hypothetical protein
VDCRALLGGYGGVRGRCSGGGDGLGERARKVRNDDAKAVVHAVGRKGARSMGAAAVATRSVGDGGGHGERERERGERREAEGASEEHLG